MEMEIVLNFEKTYISKSIGTVLQEKLPPNEVKTLNKILQGKKAQYQEANGLLYSILRVMENRGEEEELEFEIAEKNETQEPPQAEHLEQAGCTQNNQQQEQDIAPNTSSNIPKKDKTDKGNTDYGSRAPNQNHNPSQKKQKEICRFYARGNCNRGGDCRFEHPNICKKFRQFGIKSSDPKGCEGNCESFHPNACRGSLYNRTCSFKDCRFFHLKGTKTITRDQNGASNQNWRSTQHPSTNSDQNRANSDPKNWKAGLDRAGKTRKREFQNPADDTISTRYAREEQVTKKEIQQLGQTLEVIMTRLAAMESRHTVYPLPAGFPHSQGQPQPSPSVLQPGTQTQLQWGSQNSWPQTQY